MTNEHDNEYLLNDQGELTPDELAQEEITTLMREREDVAAAIAYFDNAARKARLYYSKLSSMLITRGRK